MFDEAISKKLHAKRIAINFLHPNLDKITAVRLSTNTILNTSETDFFNVTKHVFEF